MISVFYLFIKKHRQRQLFFRMYFLSKINAIKFGLKINLINLSTITNFIYVIALNIFLNNIKTEVTCFSLRKDYSSDWSMPITTKVASSNPIHDKAYWIQHYVIKFVSDLRQVGGFLRVLWFLQHQNGSNLFFFKKGLQF
jgi:hypothetical protein